MNTGKTYKEDRDRRHAKALSKADTKKVLDFLAMCRPSSPGAVFNNLKRSCPSSNTGGIK